MSARIRWRTFFLQSSGLICLLIRPRSVEMVDFFLALQPSEGRGHRFESCRVRQISLFLQYIKMKTTSRAEAKNALVTTGSSRIFQIWTRLFILIHARQNGFFLEFISQKIVVFTKHHR